MAMLAMAAKRTKKHFKVYLYLEDIEDEGSENGLDVDETYKKDKGALFCGHLNRRTLVDWLPL